MEFLGYHIGIPEDFATMILNSVYVYTTACLYVPQSATYIFANQIIKVLLTSASFTGTEGYY